MKPVTFANSSVSGGRVRTLLCPWNVFYLFIGDSIGGLTSANAELASLCHRLEVAFVGGNVLSLLKRSMHVVFFQNNC